MRTVAVLAGAGLYALAFPPFGHSAAAWLTLVPVLLAVHDCSWRRAFGYGVFFGFGFGWAVTWWLAQALARYIGAGLPVGVLAMSGAYVLAVGIPVGVFAAGASVLLGARARVSTPFAIAALWTATELLRGRLLGQPWGLLGYTQHGHTAIVQVAALTGVYGVSFLLALANVTVALVVLDARTLGRRRTLALVASPLVVILGVTLGGAIAARRGPMGGFGGRRVAIVQTNVPPAFEWTPAYAQRQLQTHVEATDRIAASAHPALIVWPENAIPRYLETDPSIAAVLAQVAMRHHADLLFGAPRYEDGRTYNSVRLITAAGRNGGVYDKQHLVLLAETDPLAPPSPGGPNASPRRFSAGEGPSILSSFVPVAPSICHEVIYPELITRGVRAGAALLVNVSNDGWLDTGSGAASQQHFAMALFRAVETRRYLVRAAVTGMSGVVDPYGRVLDSLPAGTAGALTVAVAGRGGLTPYVRFGDVFAIACALAAAAALWVVRPLAARQRKRFVAVPARS